MHGMLHGGPAPGPHELCRGRRNPEAEAMYLSADWQVIMLYWSTDISGVIHPFTRLVGKGEHRGERGTWKRVKGAEVERVCQTTQLQRNAELITTN